MSGTYISSLVGKITVLIVICSCSLSAHGKYGGGTGQPNDPYLIYEANQMNAIGADSNDWDKCFKLMADIDLSAYTGNEFNIIGKWVAYPFEHESNPFIGVFDGDNHTISNFIWSSIGRDGIGLFGYLGESGRIKHLCLEDVNVDSGNADNVAGLVGYNEGTVTGCYSTGYVSGRLKIGGLVGHNYEGTISDCYSSANVSGYWSVGGLAGRNYSGRILRCYSTGNVLGAYGVGGLVGENAYRKAVILNCYSTATVSADGIVGGLVGMNYQGTIANCYSAGSVTGTEETVGGLVGSNTHRNSGSWGTVIVSFWDIETSGQLTSAGGIGKTTAEMKTADTFFAWGSCNDAAAWAIDVGNDYPRLLYEGKPGIPLPKLSDFLLGNGTENNPYRIYTSEQLNIIGLAVCDWDKHFKLMADIDLSTYTQAEFNIIGCDGIPFIGIFNGGDYKVSNFKWNSENVSFVGLFAYVGSEGHIKNLGLENVDVNASNGSYVGGLVGESEGRITDCYSTGIVTSKDSKWGGIGGLVGHNRGEMLNCYSIGTVSGRWIIGGLVGHNFGTISDCWTTSSATGDIYIAGLVGKNSFGVIKRCFSEAEVSGMSHVGGLAGDNWISSITTSYSSGNVQGENSVGGLLGSSERSSTSDSYSTANVSGDSFVGGLTGHNHDMIANCYSTGAVYGNRRTGGLVGYNHGTVTNSFWDIETSGQLTSPSGTGLPTDQMQTMSTFTDAGWDFLGEKANGINDFWFIPQEDYPHLWWQGLEVSMKLTPRTLKCSGKGKWVKARLTLPEGFTYADVDSNRPAVLHSFGFDSTPLDVSVNEDEMVEIEAAFEREEVCSLAGDWPPELTVAGFLTDGNIFLGTSAVRMIAPGMKELQEFALYWLNSDCVYPDWCDESDMNRDSMVNFLDYALLQDNQVEFVSE